MRTRNFFKQYFYSSNKQLIAIIEQSEDFQKEAASVAKELLEGREVDMESIHNHARSIMHERLKIYFGCFNIYQDKLEIPESEFLTESEVFEIFSIEYDNYLEDRNSFRLDMNQYRAA